MGGMISAGTTHLAITPDVLKVSMQVNPVKYNSIPSGFSTLLREHGHSYLWRGWSGKLLGYGVQGGCRFGLYDSASAQIFADMVVCPFEAIKVRVQTQPMFAKGLLDGFPKVNRNEGLAGFHMGLFPLWCRNLPFSMVMFSTFEQLVECGCFFSLQQQSQECVAGCEKHWVCWSLHQKSSCSNHDSWTCVITLQWFFYDAIKVLSGFPTSGGVQKLVDATKVSV
ncbi:unnamed protein product [Brassica rapa]|uniref:Uncharacterized protein n=1 Tax=Brassica campestris TaxID=3711 RepID=A0A8D9HJA4_BRACM|nr:unnamed protein product [Brassica rapa]